jgi:hypothetical protein
MPCTCLGQVAAAWRLSGGRWRGWWRMGSGGPVWAGSERQRVPAGVPRHPAPHQEGGLLPVRCQTSRWQPPASLADQQASRPCLPCHPSASLRPSNPPPALRLELHAEEVKRNAVQPGPTFQLLDRRCDPRPEGDKASGPFLAWTEEFEVGRARTSREAAALKRTSEDYSRRRYVPL